MDIEKIGEELSRVLKTNNLGEIVLSSVVEVSKGITIITALLNVGNSVRDQLFCKKMLYFLNELKEIPIVERDNQIDKIDKSEKYKVKVGEKLLYIIDSSEDHEKSGLIGTVFKHFINKEITYEEFIDVASVINKISIKDFNWFIDHGCRRKTKKVNENPTIISSLCGAKYGEEFSLDEVRGLIGSGLFEMSYEPLDVVVSETYDYKILLEGGSKYSTTTHGGVLVFISSAGEIILKVFSKNYVFPDPYKRYLRSAKK